MRFAPAFAGALLATLVVSAGAAHGASLEPVGEDFARPVYVTSDPGNPDRLFVLEREGAIELVEGEETSLFSDLSSVVDCCGGERGLLSMALSPSFEQTGLLYVYYTGLEEPGEIHVGELHAVDDEAPAETLRNVLTIPHPGESNHNGGSLQFGPDGYLYISTGDGGGSDDQHHNAQDLTSLLGKILRIDPAQNGQLPFSVPAGNPFAGAAPPADAIWSYGLRNPFRFSFDRFNHAIVIGDVGQDDREEVDYAPSPGLGKGANYGWNCREGLAPGPGGDQGCPAPPASGFGVDPIFDYPHADPGGEAAHGCAIIGGYVSRDPGVPELKGRYVYGDLCVGEIRSFDPAHPLETDRSEGLEVESLNSFGEDSCGRLYAVAGSGEVSRFEGTTPTDCTAEPEPEPEPPSGPVNGRPSPLSPSPLLPRATELGIDGRRVVRRGTRATISVSVTPCEGRTGTALELRRGGRPLLAGVLDEGCTSRFRPRIAHRSTFRALVPESAGYLGATSPRLTIHVRQD